MMFRYSLLGGVMLVAAGIVGARAQSPIPQASWMVLCLEKLTPLHDEMKSRWALVKAALAKKPPNDGEACAQLTKYHQSQLYLLLFIRENNNPATCPVPPELVSKLEASQANTERMGKKVCGVTKVENRGVPPKDSRGVPPWPKGRIAPTSPGL